MLTSIVDTTELYHFGRFKRLIIRDIQAFQGLRGTLALPTGLEPVFSAVRGRGWGAIMKAPSGLVLHPGQRAGFRWPLAGRRRAPDG
jgi:hypothetical protein